MATYMDKEFICKKDISIIKLNNDTISYKYVLALLNSKFLSFYKTKNSFSAKEDDFIQITLGEGSFLFQKLILSSNKMQPFPFWKLFNKKEQKV
jgi:hypothetical protein